MAGVAGGVVARLVSVAAKDRMHPAYLALFTQMARARLARRRFSFRGSDYSYFVHAYNETWRNERAVEIPIVRDLLGGNVLEVGNVLSHYGVSGHTVVDKYERAMGVLNVDALDYRPTERFDAIVSISTVEHMGFDEDERDDGKPRRAIEHLSGMLAPGGTLVATIPLGYNVAAVPMCMPGNSGVFTEVAFLKRVSETEWSEASWDAVKAMPYNAPFPAANALAVGFVRA